MLQLTAKCLDVTVEVVQGPSGPFESTTIHLLSGQGAETSVERVRVGRDFPRNQLPGKDETITLNVVVSTWSGKNGTGYRLTALSRADARKVAAAS